MVKKLLPNSDAWGGSWGMASAWGGSWGWSWGPLHEVAETWDTAQGMAQPNLRFEPIRDVEVRVPPTRAVVKTTTKVTCSAGAVAASSVFVSAGYARAPRSTGVANAFVRVARHGAVVGVRGGNSTADASAPGRRFSCRSSHRGVVSLGEATVGAVAYGCGVTVRSPRAQGVMNPSDEEMASIAYMLVRNSLTTRNKRVYMRT